MSERTFEYDAVIVGAGLSGGVVAGILAEAGRRVLLLERGKSQTFADTPRDHLRNHRLALYGHNTGPDLTGNPRVSIGLDGDARLVNPHQDGYDNNAMVVGGGGLVYGAQAWRFLPQDFRMASVYGVPDGSSLADWPISYDDLAPYYERAEWEIGVAADSDKMATLMPRRRGYPMPRVPDNPARLALQRGADALGWQTAPVPLAINTEPYLGRPACTQCSYCVGFACPVDAKNGSHNTLLPRALATGNCEFVTRAIVERIETDARGTVTGVSYLRDDGQHPIERHAIRARNVIICGGAIETARLLLNSKSDHHPHGLGNHSDQLGRHYNGHVYVGAYGLFDEPVTDGGIGPGVSISTCQFSHGNPGVVGGGMIADEFVKLPIIFWRGARPKDVPRWGQANKDWMRTAFRRTLNLAAPIHDIPAPDSRVQVDPNVRDKYGIPVARLSGGVHPETLKSGRFIQERAEEWMRASGAAKVWGWAPGWMRSGGQHQAGTCRMGHDPKSSVTDPTGRVHGHDNLFVADGSLHVTNGGFNPMLTILALAFRTAEHIASSGR